MENKIYENIVERLSRHFTPSYMYTEQSSLPYCVYEVAQESPVYAKSGIIGYKAEATIYLAAATEGASVEMKNKALSVLSERQRQFAINITSVQPAFGEDQWLQKIDFQITQLF